MRLVLAVARTVTATVRLLDVLEFFRSDARIQVVFAIDSGSRFSAGVPELLQAVGARVVTYRDLLSLNIDLVITTSSTADVGPGIAPVLVLPHGIGYHKYISDGPGGELRLSGVVSAVAAQTREITQVLTSEGQRAQLAGHRPEVRDRAIVVRDPFMDRLRAGQTLREDYRRRLGVGDRQLVVMTSTWGEQSLFSRWQRLPAQLLRQLPADEYAVAAILHPNVWSGNGPWQVRTWLADARDAGLILVPPTAGWQATLVSADAAIGDHGSVTFYAAALGLPVLLGAFGTEVVPGTPMARLGRLAPVLDWDAPLAEQIQKLTRSHDPEAYKDVTGQAFGGGGPLTPSLRTVIYRALDLPEPDSEPEIRAWPVPDVECTPVTSYAMYSRTMDTTVYIWRFPAAVDAPSPRLDPVRRENIRHLAAYAEELDLGRRQSAASLTHRNLQIDSDVAAKEWISRQPRAHRLTAIWTGTRHWVQIRDGRLVHCSISQQVEPLLITAVVYHLLVRGELPTSGQGQVTVPVVVGAQAFTVTMTMTPEQV